MTAVALPLSFGCLDSGSIQTQKASGSEPNLLKQQALGIDVQSEPNHSHIGAKEGIPTVSGCTGIGCQEEGAKEA